MLFDTVCPHCPQSAGCRCRVAGISVAEIAYWAVHRRDAAYLLRRYPRLGVEDVRRAVELYIDCPAHDGASTRAPRRQALRAVA